MHHLLGIVIGIACLFGSYLFAGYMQEYKWEDWQHHVYGIGAIFLSLLSIFVFVVLILDLIGVL